MTAPRPESLERARTLHEKCIVLDSHVDTTQQLAPGKRDLGRRNDRGHIDIPRLREGGVSAAVFAVWDKKPAGPGDGIRSARRQIESIRSFLERYGEDLSPARTAADIRRAKESGKIAVPFAIEGGYLFEQDLDVLREFAEAGAIYLTLTHMFHTEWADSSGVHQPLEPLHGGLTGFGREVIGELNRLGMMVDVSHVSDDTFRDVIEISRAPVVATHSSCRAIADHRRNLTDDMMKTIAETGGVVQINFCAAFIDSGFPEIDPDAVKRYWDSDGEFEVTDHVVPLSVLVDHFDHALRVVGPDHVGVGSDFDGVAALPEDMTDCSMLPNLTAALFERGYGEDELEKVLGGNFLRVMDACRSRQG